VISSFRFHKHPAERASITHRVTIDAALITGHAARTVSANGMVNQSIGALAGTTRTTEEIGLIRFATFSRIEGMLEQMVQDDPQSPAVEKLAGLRALTAELPERYPVDVYERKTETTIALLHRRGDEVPRETFANVAEYVGQLTDSMAAIRTVLNKQTTVEPTRTPAPATGPTTAPAFDTGPLEETLRGTAAAVEDVTRRVSRSPALRNAADFVLGFKR
jgi:hypothetical protein